MKSERQEVIVKIISEKNIETQHQLQQALAELGVGSTQATLSRDIRALKLVKEQGPDGKQHYVLPQTEKKISGSPDDTLRLIFKQSVISSDTAGNLAVLKTYPGLASAACAAVDGADIPGIVGTIAGEDTVFIAMKTAEIAAGFIERMHEYV